VPPKPGVAVVTGASSGIGAALARTLTRRGWRCVLVARREDRLQALAEELGCDYELCDVSDRASVELAAAAIGKREPSIRLLVNNAGIPARTSFAEGEPDRIESVVRTNYLGSVWCLRAFLPLLQAPASVVNVVSVAGEIAGGPYAASKHAQLAFSRSIAVELAPRSIRVLTVKPGFVETEGFPQGRLPSPARRIVLTPERVAERIVDALDRRRPEITVPSFYRPLAILQAVAPGTFTRLAVRFRRRL
jgi:NAD(P)-dependent dehydrogenase (short-subunit alcohol dehydrogenase family)